MPSTAVKVAIRVRPHANLDYDDDSMPISTVTLTQCHEEDYSKIVTVAGEARSPSFNGYSSTHHGESILMGGEKNSFMFDYAFGEDSTQQDVYQSSVAPLVSKFIEGYNVTVFAYGQTGSGKTFTMGTDTSVSEWDSIDESSGMIQRAATDIFNELHKRQLENPTFQYELQTAFLELYNEELIDLFAIASDPPGRRTPRQQRSGSISHTTTGGKDMMPSREDHTIPGRSKTSMTATREGISIREDIGGGIILTGIREELVASPEDLMNILRRGSMCRQTAATSLNDFSSRSHAIFTIMLTQVYTKTATGTSDVNPVYISATSKFHFVDLAGSERLKRTNAVGDRAKEGISINSGLLALGKVISALSERGDNVKGHIPYRDSKLTRLLQDSLGGNSQTLMVACVSPSLSDLAETRNTLRYAARARDIKNEVILNLTQDDSSKLETLKKEISRLRGELDTLKIISEESQLMKVTLELEKENLAQSLLQKSEECKLFRSKLDKMEEDYREYRELQQLQSISGISLFDTPFPLTSMSNIQSPVKPISSSPKSEMDHQIVLDEIDALKKEINAKDEQIASAKLEFEKDIQNYMNSLKKEKELLDIKTELLEQSQLEIKALKITLKSEREKLGQMEIEMSQTTKNNDKEVASILSEVTLLEQKTQEEHELHMKEMHESRIIISDLEDQIELLSNQVKSLQAMGSELESKHAEEMSNVIATTKAEAELKISNIAKQLELKEQEISQLKSEHEFEKLTFLSNAETESSNLNLAQDMISRKEAEVQSLVQEISSLRNQIVDLEKSSESHTLTQDNLVNIERELISTQAVLAKTEEDTLALVNEVNSLRTGILGLEALNQQLQTENNLKNEESNELKSNMKSLQNHLQQIQDEANTQSILMKEEIQSLHSENGSLKSQLQALLTSSKSQQEELMAFRKAQPELIASSIRSMTELEILLEEMTLDRDHLTQQLSEKVKLEKELVDMTRECEFLKSVLEESNQLAEQFMSLSSEKSLVMNENKDHIKRLKDANEKIEKVMEQNRVLENQVQILEKEKDDMNETITILTKEYEELIQQNEILETTSAHQRQLYQEDHNIISRERDALRDALDAMRNYLAENPTKPIVSTCDMMIQTIPQCHERYALDLTSKLLYQNLIVSTQVDTIEELETQLESEKIHNEKIGAINWELKLVIEDLISQNTLKERKLDSLKRQITSLENRNRMEAIFIRQRIQNEETKPTITMISSDSFNPIPSNSNNVNIEMDQSIQQQRKPSADSVISNSTSTLDSAYGSSVSISSLDNSPVNITLDDLDEYERSAQEFISTSLSYNFNGVDVMDANTATIKSLPQVPMPNPSIKIPIPPKRLRKLRPVNTNISSSQELTLQGDSSTPKDMNSCILHDQLEFESKHEHQIMTAMRVGSIELLSDPIDSTFTVPSSPICRISN